MLACACHRTQQSRIVAARWPLQGWERTLMTHREGGTAKVDPPRLNEIVGRLEIPSQPPDKL